jgi:hypothetical protein
MATQFKHHHVWSVAGKCVRSNANCDATRCGATVVQFRRGKPYEMRCKAAVGKYPNLCDRCFRCSRQTWEEMSA